MKWKVYDKKQILTSKFSHFNDFFQTKGLLRNVPVVGDTPRILVEAGQESSNGDVSRVVSFQQTDKYRIRINFGLFIN